MPVLRDNSHGQSRKTGLLPGLAQLEGEIVKVRISGQHFTKVKKAALGLWEKGRSLGSQ